MSDFSATQTDPFNVQDSIDDDESLATRHTQTTVTPGSPDSSSSGSHAVIGTASAAITLSADEVVTIRIMVSVSTGTSGDRLEIKVRNTTDAVDIGIPHDFEGPSANTGGDSGTVTICVQDSGRSGSTTYAASWARTSGSGTIYSKRQTISLSKSKQHS